MKGSCVAFLPFIVFLYSGCSPLVYVPGPHPIAFVEQPGDTRGTVRAGTGLRGGTGFDVASQVVHAPLEQVLVHASVQGSLRERYRQVFGEAGVGFYAHLSRRLTVEVLGAYGRGGFRSEDEENLVEYTATTTLEGTYERVYAQVNAGLHTTYALPTVDRPVPGIFGLGLRIAHVQGDRFQWNRLTTPEPFQEVYAEPVLFARIGDGAVQVEWQIGSCLPVGTYNPDYDWQWLSASVGISMALNDLLGY